MILVVIVIGRGAHTHNIYFLFFGLPFLFVFCSSFVLLKVRQIRHKNKHSAYEPSPSPSNVFLQGIFVSPMGGKFDDAPLMPGSVWFRLLACTTAIFFFAARLEEGVLEPTLGWRQWRDCWLKKSPIPATWLYLGGGNSKIFYFRPYLGKWSNLTNIFQMGWNYQPDIQWILEQQGLFFAQKGMMNGFCREINLNWGAEWWNTFMTWGCCTSFAGRVFSLIIWPDKKIWKKSLFKRWKKTVGPLPWTFCVFFSTFVFFLLREIIPILPHFETLGPSRIHLCTLWPSDLSVTGIDDACDTVSTSWAFQLFVVPGSWL